VPHENKPRIAFAGPVPGSDYQGVLVRNLFRRNSARRRPCPS
jgi:hypothetical protein